MSIQTKEVLKTYFETNDVPTQTQFGSLIDTLHETLSDGSINVEKLYFSSAVGDVLNDWRVFGDETGFYFQICTGANDAKGTGDWVTKFKIEI